VPADPYLTPPEATEPVPSTPDAGILSEAHSEAEKCADEAEAEAKRLFDEAEAEAKRVEGLDPF
jgi:cell division septum initiation protein DivIVA